MPNTCPVCSKYCYTYKFLLECTSCRNWVHHGNSLQCCSGLTDGEFEDHKADELNHLSAITATLSVQQKEKTIKLPFPIECEGSIFGKPDPRPKSDNISMTPSQLKKFVDQCRTIENQLENHEDETDEAFSFLVNARYYNIKNFNILNSTSGALVKMLSTCTRVYQKYTFSENCIVLLFLCRNVIKSSGKKFQAI